MNASGIIRTFGVVTLFVALSVRCVQIHELMTDDEIANLFHTTRDNIPEYEVVPVRHNRYRRPDRSLRIQFAAYDEKVDAYLHPSDGVLAGSNTPVWLAFTKPDGTIEYKKIYEEFVGRAVYSFFTGSTDYSTIGVIQEFHGKPYFNGIIGERLIRPIPKRLRMSVIIDSNRETRNADRTMIDTDYHVIIKSTAVTEQEKIRLLEKQIREASRSNNGTNTFREKRSEMEVIFPSLLIQTDFKRTSTTQDEADYCEEIIYQLAFWNAVDLRFRHVDDPKIRLRISGIIIGLDRTAIPYLQNHRSNDCIDVNQAWPKAQEYWARMAQRADFSYEAYDIVVTMTDSKMTLDGNQILGLATIYSCPLETASNFYSLALVADNGGFDGVLVATHELGHLFGLDHDTESGDECDRSHGFIMSPTMSGVAKGLEWSPCSLKTLSKVLRKSYDHCYDEPAEFYPPGIPVKKVLPGDALGPHKQCQARGYASACDPSQDMCTQMQCYYSGWSGLIHGWWCQNAGPAAEGTECAPKHKCLDGVCQCMTPGCIYITADSIFYDYSVKIE